VLIGIFIGLAHLLKNTTATIIVFQLVIYSCLFGLLGSQLYKWKGERDGWRPGKRSDRGWGRIDKKPTNDVDESEDTNTGWK